MIYTRYSVIYLSRHVEVRRFSSLSSLFVINIVTVKLKSLHEARKLDEPVLVVNQALESYKTTSRWKSNHLMDVLYKGKKYKGAFSVKSKMDLAGMAPSARALDGMVECYVHVNRPELGLGVAGLIMKHGFEMKMYVVNLILKNLLLNGEINKATELFQLAGRNGSLVNVVSYNTTMNGRCKAKKMEEAQILFSEMETSNCTPDTVTYSTLMKGFCKNGRVEEAVVLLDKMNVTGQQPDLHSYSLVITGLCRLKSFDRAKQVFEEMLKKGLTPNAVVFNSLMHCFSKAGQCKETTALFNTMLERGIQADSILYSSLIDGLCKNGRVKSAQDTFRLMVEKGREPTISAYNSLIDGLCCEGMMQDAMKFLDGMRESGLKPDVIMYSVLMKGLCAKRASSDAMRLLNFMLEDLEGVKADLKTFSILIRGLCEEGRLKEAVVVHDKMLVSGYAADLIEPVYTRYLDPNTMLVCIILCTRLLVSGVFVFQGMLGFTGVS